MKKRHLAIKLLSYSFIICLIISSCSKDRVTQDSFQPLNSFYTANQQQEQVWTVTDTGAPPCLHIGAQGTKLYNFCDSSQFIRTTDSMHITYPYQMGLVEIYTAKDMIMWPLPSVSNGMPLQTGGNIRVRAFKSGSNDVYNLAPGREYEATLNDSTANVIAMSVYDGSAWSLDATSTVTTTPPLDSLGIFNLGWISCARAYTPASTGIVTVTVAGTGTQNIGIFVVFKNFKSVMQITNLVSAPIPTGQPFTFVAFALNQNNQYVLDQRVITLNGNQSISLNMQPISQSDLLSFLSGL